MATGRAILVASACNPRATRDLTEATAETLSFARRMNLDPAEIVDLLQSTPLGAPYAVQKARSMLAGDFSPAFALKHALKDAKLAAQAARHLEGDAAFSGRGSGR